MLFKDFTGRIDEDKNILYHYTIDSMSMIDNNTIAFCQCMVWIVWFNLGSSWLFYILNNWQFCTLYIGTPNLLFKCWIWTFVKRQMTILRFSIVSQNCFWVGVFLHSFLNQLSCAIVRLPYSDKRMNVSKFSLSIFHVNSHFQFSIIMYSLYNNQVVVE